MINTVGAPTPNPSGDITATYTVNCGAGSNANFTGVIVADGAKILSAGYSDEDSKDLGVVVKGDVIPLTVGGQVPSNGTFSLLLDVKDSGTNGLSRLSIEVPVCPISDVKSYPGTWYIRGGMNQTVLDEGKDADAPIGGAVLLGVGPTSAWGIDIEIAP